MEFQPIEDLPPEQFTEVYGDCFISGFLEGGEFNAVISVNVHDKSKVRQVKQAIDLQLAVGPSPVSIGAQESTSKDHSELLQDTEITISVNWSGGGDIKKRKLLRLYEFNSSLLMCVILQPKYRGHSLQSWPLRTLFLQW